jgi:tetratricopeptide (TPR) repeat protein
MMREIRPEIRPEIRLTGDAVVNEAALFASASQLFSARRLPEAEAATRRLIAASPRHARGLHLLGTVLAQRGHFAEAIGFLSRAVAIDDRLAQAWVLLGGCHSEIGQHAEAAAAFRRTLALEPDNAFAHLGLGDTLTARGRAAEADESYKRALVLNPILAQPHNPLGAALREYGLYISHRPDSDIVFHLHPEFRELLPKWTLHNDLNNAGDLSRLYLLMLNVKQVLDAQVPGQFAELGVYRGNSAAILAHYARRFGRQLYLFDTFQGFDARDLKGIDADKAAIFADTSLELVRSVVGEDGVTFVRGYFPESIPPGFADEAFAVVHLDCDLYEPFQAALAFFYPRLSPGGMLILHDYSSGYFAGARQAVDEFAATVPEQVVLMPDKSGTAILRKNRSAA